MIRPSDLKKILSKPSPGLYVFAGPETYLKRAYVRAFRTKLLPNEDFSMFNYVRLEGEDLDLGELKDAVFTPPMAEDFKLVEVHLCKLEKWKSETVKELMELAKQIERDGYTICIFVVEPEDLQVSNPSKLIGRSKELDGFTTLVYFDKAKKIEIEQWLEKKCIAEGIKIDFSTLDFFLEYVGSDMDTLDNEIAKILYYAHAKGMDSITKEMIKTVSILAENDDVFLFSNAILERKKEDAFAALYKMKNDKNDPQMVFGSLVKIYSDLLSIRTMIDEGTPRSEICEAIGMKEYRYALYERASLRVSATRLEKILRACQASDRKMKTSMQRDFGEIEKLVALVI